MTVNKETLADLLARTRLPGSGRSLAESGSVVQVAACDGYVTVGLALAALAPEARQGVAREVEAGVRELAARAGETLHQVTIATDVPKPPPRVVPLAQAGPGPRNSAGPGAPGPGGSGRPGGAGGGAGGGGGQASAPALPGVRHVVAVGAGKGGVGKSTVAVNLAVGLARRGLSVGLLDGDIYGPSLPTMLGLDGLQANLVGTMLQPFLVHGVKAMTIGKLVDPEKPLIWRGPMAHGAFKQLVEQTEWGPLDYLVIDLPPGTGDVSLTLAQLLRLTGAVVVCTPQKVAQDDAVRALRMFQQLGIDVLGVVENMSYFIGDDGKEYDIFGRGGAQMLAQRTGTPFLGAVPINMALRRNSDAGDPSANFQSGTALSRELEALVRNLESQVALASMRSGASGPVLTIS